jgi:hypothetical protein
MRLIFYLTTFLFCSNINVIPFKIVPLGSYTPMETLFPLLVEVLEVFSRYDLPHIRYTLLDVLWSPEITSFEDIFKFWKNEQVRWGGLGNHGKSSWGQKFCDRVDSVTWDVVMMENLFVCNVWYHGNDPFSEPFRDVFIKNLVTSVTDMLEDHTGWRLTALLPKVGTPSPSVGSCPRGLFWMG